VSRPALSLALSLVLAVVATPARAQRNAGVPDPDPEVERRSFRLPQGFEANLYAADPLLAKPIQMNFDPAGRLWVVASEVYPQIAPGQAANDKVLVIEDRDGDGTAETSTVFADGLLIPTGIEPGDGGAYVANSTELIHLADADGDGKADRRRVVLSGFGTEDTHHLLHTLRWGPDGCLYMNQSIYIHSHVETPHGVRRLNGGGVWRFRPETVRLEVFTRGLVNPWGHAIDRFGQSFLTDGAGGEGINWALPGAYFVTAVDAVRLLPGLNPGSPKYCGLEIVDGRHLPEDWRGTLVTNDFRANRVCRFEVKDAGAGFASRELPEPIRATHPAFRPIDVKQGPDGAIYVADWYNPIIQHGEVDFRDPRRDHTRGRIWRITAKGRPLVARPDLVKAPVPQLLDALMAPEGFTRQQARRVLKERGAKAVLPALGAWLAKWDGNAPENQQARLEALWIYQSLDTPEPALLRAVLQSRDAHRRAAAVRVLGEWAGAVEDVDALLDAAVADADPRVRLEAVRVLATRPGPDAVARALRVLDRPMDPFLDYAAWLTARETAPAWVPALASGRSPFGANVEPLLFAARAANAPEAVPAVLDALRADRVPPARRGEALGLIAALGRPDDLGLVLTTAMGAGDPALRATLLEGLAVASRSRKVKPSGDLARVAALLDDPSPALRAAAARAVGAWGLSGESGRLQALARRAGADANEQAGAVEGLAALGNAESRRLLGELAGIESSPALRTRAIGALVPIDPDAAARAAAALLAEGPAGLDPAAVVNAFLARKDGPDALARRLSGSTLQADVAKVAVRAARAAPGGAPALAGAITEAGKLGERPPLPSPEERRQILAEVASSGDPLRGEGVFRRADLACLKCHAIAGAGGQVGPSLESIGASAPADYLLDSLLEPDKAIKENYHSLVVATADGRVVTGLKVREGEGTLVLRDAEGVDQVLPLDDIEDRKQGGSLMPAGQTDALTRAELVDLVRFLASLGKAEGLSVGPVPVARRWEVLVPQEAQRPDLRRLGYVAAVRGDLPTTWAPAYSTVAGVLPTADLPPFETLNSPDRVALARCAVDVAAAGPLRLEVNLPPEAFTLWLDGQEVPPGASPTVDLAAGRHLLTFAVRPAQAGSGLRVALGQLPGSAAQAQFVTGK
jgi:putative heme-binding domain-containing protein